MITSFNGKLIGAEYGSWERYKFCLGLVYTVIMFFASLNCWEGLKFYFNKLVENISRRDYGEQGMGRPYPPHVKITLLGLFKGYKVERCHFLSLEKYMSYSVSIRVVVKLLLKLRKEMNVNLHWAFVDSSGLNI